MSNNIIYDNIFEAIANLEPSNVAINLKTSDSSHIVRNLKYNIIPMPDGTTVAFPSSPILFTYYRGENDDYDLKYPCVPSIYRIKNENERIDGQRNLELVLIDKLKLIDFELITEHFPQVYYAKKDFCNVNFEALAQHYELNTTLLDLTSDLLVAAFFATHYNDFTIKTDGIGCIRRYISFPYDDPKFKIIGLQPFQRPGQQCALGLTLDASENFSLISTKTLFKQNDKYNKKIHDIFYINGKNTLFPDEEISEIAKLIKKENCISSMAISKYCSDNNSAFVDIERILAKHDIVVTNSLIYSLNRNQRRKLERFYKEKPYGNISMNNASNINLFSRPMYIPD